MQHSRLILAFAVVLAIVVLAGSMRCDSYADIDAPLTLSSEFRKPERNKPTSSPTSKSKSIDEIRAGLPQDKVTFFEHANLGGGRQAFDEKSYEQASPKIPGEPGTYHSKDRRRWSSVYVPPGFEAKLYKWQSTFSDGPLTTIQYPGMLNFKDVKDLNDNIGIFVISRGSSAKSIQSVQPASGNGVNGCKFAVDDDNYRYRVRKQYGDGPNDYRCPTGWEDTACQNPERRQCRARRNTVSKDSKNKPRSKCNKLAKKNQEEFKSCAGLKGGKRTGCVGKNMGKCLERVVAAEYDTHKKQGFSGPDATVYSDINFGGTPGRIVTPGHYPRLSKHNFNNMISSMKVPDGWKLIAYEHSKFKGKPKTFTGDVSYVGDDWNDTISSLRTVPA